MISDNSDHPISTPALTSAQLSCDTLFTVKLKPRIVKSNWEGEKDKIEVKDDKGEVVIENKNVDKEEVAEGRHFDDDDVEETIRQPEKNKIISLV